MEPGAAFNPLNADPDIVITDFVRGEDLLVIPNDPVNSQFSGFEIRPSSDGLSTEVVLSGNAAFYDNNTPVQRIIVIQGVPDFDETDIRFTDADFDLINTRSITALPDCQLTAV